MAFAEQMQSRSRRRAMARETARHETGLDADEPICIGQSEVRDPFVARARPGFLYVMYAMILAALPVGAIAAVRPDIADAGVRGMAAYLAALPEPLYALFAAGYLGYTAARQWGKVSGSDH